MDEQRPVPAILAGQAFRATVSPTAAGQARAIAAVSPSIGPKRPSSRRTSKSSRSITVRSPRRG